MVAILVLMEGVPKVDKTILIKLIKQNVAILVLMEGVPKDEEQKVLHYIIVCRNPCSNGRGTQSIQVVHTPAQW